MELKAEIRTITGGKVKQLRENGEIPSVIYGHNFPAEAITLNLKEFTKVYRQAGEAELVDLNIKGRETMKVLIKDIQSDPLTGLTTHADFYKVDLAEKVTAHVEVKITGESPAVKAGQAMLLVLLHEVEVEALPLDLPSAIIVDISGLLNIGDHLAVKDLSIDQTKVKIKHAPEDIVVKLDYAEMKEEVVETPVTPEEVEITKEKKDEVGEGTEEAKGEGEKKSAAKPAAEVKEEKKEKKEKK